MSQEAIKHSVVNMPFMVSYTVPGVDPLHPGIFLYGRFYGPSKYYFYWFDMTTDATTVVYECDTNIYKPVSNASSATAILAPSGQQLLIIHETDIIKCVDMSGTLCWSLKTYNQLEVKSTKDCVVLHNGGYTYYLVDLARNEVTKHQAPKNMYVYEQSYALIGNTLCITSCGHCNSDITMISLVGSKHVTPSESANKDRTEK